MTTLQDIARDLSMHKSTVSLALSGKGNVSAATRERVIAFARERGYEPNPLAQRLARGFDNALVCIFSGGLDVGLTTEKVLLIQQALSATGLDVPIYTCARGSEAAGAVMDGVQVGSAQQTQIRQLCRQRPRAILCATSQADPRIFTELADYQRAGGIVVSYDSPIALTCDQIIFDREDNAYQAARHLLSEGHRRIGIGFTHLLGVMEGAENATETARMVGFRRALGEFGLTPQPDWVFHNAAYEKGGAEMARQFLQLTDRPTGLCIVNDYVALAFMVEVMRAGVRVPEDVSIVSHDNQPIAAYCPVPLTSVTHPTSEIVRCVVESLQARLEEESDGGVAERAAPKTTVVRGELVVRASVSRPSATMG